jgi:hypothetical protein
VSEDEKRKDALTGGHASNKMSSSFGFNLATGENFRQIAVAQQQNVRWLAGALGGAGVALAVGIGVANVPGLDAYQPLAVAGVLLALFGIAVSLWRVFQALGPAEVTVTEAVRVTPATTARGEKPAAEGDLSRPLKVLAAAEAENLRLLDLPLAKLVEYLSWTDANQSIEALDMRDNPETDRDLRARGLAELPAVAAYIAWQSPGAKGLKAPLAERLAELKIALDQLQGYLELQEVSNQVRRARAALAGAVATTVVGLGLLLLATAQADDVAVPQAITAPVRVLAFLGPRDLAKAASATGPQGPIPAGCALPLRQPVDAVAIGGTWRAPSLLLQGRGPGCPTVAVETDIDTVVAPADPITSPVPIRAWLGATHKAELLRERPAAVGECAAARGPVNATVVAGTWTQPRLSVDAVPSRHRGRPGYVCAAVMLQGIDPDTKVQPLAKP